MANTLLTSSVIMKESLRILKNELTFTRGVNREYDDKFGVTGAKVGATINARKPPRYVGRTGQALQVEASTETYVPITLDTQFGVDISFSSADLTLSIDEFADRFLKPAMATVANKVDYDGLQLYKDVNNFSGTAGLLNGGSVTSTQVQQAILAARRKMTENGVPYSPRNITVDPNSSANIVSGLTNLFNPSGTISKIFTNGALGDGVLGFNFAEDANVASFTPQAAGSLTAISSAPASGATTLAVTTTAGTVPRGTVFTVAGVYAINPQNRQSTGSLMQFVVTADTVVTTSGTLPIYPAYIPSGQFATCTGTPAGTAAIVVLSGAVGAVPYAQNLAYHKDAFTLASADLLLPGGVDMAERDNFDGISMRMVRQYDINSDLFPVRFDVLYGWKTIYPELAVRITG
jgi:uncharacterized protein YggL (DUF469 family)